MRVTAAAPRTPIAAPIRTSRPPRREGAAPWRDFLFQTAVAEFGLLLRQSELRGAADAGSVVERARGALGDDRHGYRAEFVRLVEAARSLGLGAVAMR